MSPLGSLKMPRRTLLVLLFVAAGLVAAQNGGAGSAENSANAAGTSVGTGTSEGGRTAPTSTQGFAALLSGLFFGAICFFVTAGALLALIWSYFENFNRSDGDKPLLKLGIVTILIMTLLQIAVLIVRLYDIHIKHVGNFVYILETIGWELACAYITVGITTAVSQAYFVHKAFKAYRGSRWVVALYTPLLAFTIGGSIASAALELLAGSAANVKGAALDQSVAGSTNNKGYLFSVVFATWLVSNAVIDVSLCFILIRQLAQIKSEYFSTRHAAARLILTFLETCIVTAGYSITAMVLFLASPQNFYYLIPLLGLGSVYGISFIATLLLRPSIARELALDKDSRMTRDIDKQARSAAAPTTLAKPIVKAILKKEMKKREAEDGIHITTVVDQMRSRDDDAAFRRSPVGPPILEDDGSDHTRTETIGRPASPHSLAPTQTRIPIPRWQHAGEISTEAKKEIMPFV